jgi:hypothetical protein
LRNRFLTPGEGRFGGNAGLNTDAPPLNLGDRGGRGDSAGPFAPRRPETATPGIADRAPSLNTEGRGGREGRPEGDGRFGGNAGMGSGGRFNGEARPGGELRPGGEGRVDSRDQRRGPDASGLTGRPEWAGSRTADGVRHGPGRDGGSDRDGAQRDWRTGDAREMQRGSFTERYRKGELEHVTKGQVAGKLRLDQQYRELQKGDVARRLELHKNVTNIVNVNQVNVNIGGHGHHRSYYQGRVHPHYHRDSFQFAYYGHSFFAGVHWYPRWNPWVRWSWNYSCHPIWDPRPIWCRPIIYQPAPVWIYYPVPVWQPLPVVASGTWVDVPKVIVPDQYDLQLLAVRFVDPGHPEENLGPRYRVWVRNNSSLPIVEPFSVVALASNDGRVAAGLPQAGVRVTSMESGDTQSFDVRLPADVFAMNRDAQGKAAPFGTLHVIVDSDREINETSRTNNGGDIARDAILPVDPATFGVDPNRAAAGSEVVVAGEGFGPVPGQVLVNVGGQELEAEILGWYDLGVRVALPNVAMAVATEADVIVIRGDGAAANPMKVTLTPGVAAAPAGPFLPEF